MRMIFCLPILLGCAAVLQGGLNRQIAAHFGISGATLLNCTVLLGAAALFFWIARSHPESMSWALPRESGGSLPIWFIIPGLLGFCLVAGIPFAIGRIGALQVFVWMIGAQLAASLAWDALAEGRPVSWTRALGALLSLAGALVSLAQS